MTKHIRMTLAAVALVAFASACSSDKDGEASPSATPSASPAASSPASASPSTSATTSTPAPTTSTPADTATVIDIKVAGGKVTTKDRTVKVKLGSKVRLVVTSDVADEVHVHTYDKKQDIDAGVPATIEFVANIPGQFEIELEKRSLLLVNFNVQ